MSDVLPWRRRERAVDAADLAAFRSPRVRALADRAGLDPSGIAGSGRGGRVTAADVSAAAAAGQAIPAGAARGSERVPFNRIRARAATALLASKRTAAHAFTSVVCDYTAVDDVRRAERAAWRAREGFSLTYLPFVARAVIDALGAFPMLNATVTPAGDGVVVHRAVDLSIAVDLDHEGLVVPVVRGADALRLRGIARAVVDLADRARAKRLVPDDLAGGTFTITNPGAHGTYVSVPVIHQPQVAILSTDGVAKRVVTHGPRDALVIAPVGHLCLSFDHRAVDGAYAGAFLDRVRENLETRDWRTEL